MFISDEIPVPVAGGKVVCDILALRVDGGRSTPVLLELKDARMLKRLIEQVETYSAIVNAHAESFSKLFSAVLGRPVKLNGDTENWIVWPAAGDGADPHEQELSERGIRVVGYKKNDDGYDLRVGSRRLDGG